MHQAIFAVGMLPLQHLVFAAIRAGHMVFAHVAAFVFHLDARQTLHRRRADQQHLAAGVGLGALIDQAERIALVADIPRETVDLITEHVLDGHGRQRRGRIGAAQHQYAAGEILEVFRVGTVARAAPVEDAANDRRFGQQRIETLLHPALADLQRGQHGEHRPGGVLHHVADPVQADLGLAELGREHQDDSLHRRAGR